MDPVANRIEKGLVAIDKGLVVENKYRLEDKLGAGGMGTVWVAEDLQLGRRVALKFPATELRRDPDFLERFALEARHASMVRSPHVVQVYGQGSTEDGIPYIAMELLDGCDLAQYLAQRGACGLAETGEIVEQACRALQRAHQAGLIHRDIKPQNIFVTPESDGRVFIKVLDFGIAKNLDKKVASLTRSNVGMGSLLYMSPEQLRDAKSVSPRTDIWALGVVTYELLTGKVPFDSDNALEFMHQVSSGLYTPACQVQPRLPSSVDAFFSRAMQPDPLLRFATVDEMSTAFSRIVRSNPTGVAMKNSSSATNPSQRDLPRGSPALGSSVVVATTTSRNGMILLGLGLAVALIAVVSLWRGERGTDVPSPAPPDNVKVEDGWRQLKADQAALKAEKDKVAADQAALQAEKDRLAAEEEARNNTGKDDVPGVKNGTTKPVVKGQANSGAVVKEADKQAPKLGPASDATRAAILAAIERANKFEARAQRTLSIAGLNTTHSGKLLQGIYASVKKLIAQKEFMASVPVSSKVDSVLVSSDRLTAQVRTTETWEQSWYDRSTNLCKRHVHQHPVPQTVYLKFINNSWLLDDVKFHTTSEPAVVACHG